MSRVTIDIPTTLHKAVKSFVGSTGETIKGFFVEAVEKSLIEKSQINIKSKASKDSYITEKEAEEMLKPLIIKYIKEIKEGKFEGYSKEDFFAKLEEK